MKILVKNFEQKSKFWSKILNKNENFGQTFETKINGQLRFNKYQPTRKKNQNQVKKRTTINIFSIEVVFGAFSMCRISLYNTKHPNL